MTSNPHIDQDVSAILDGQKGAISGDAFLRHGQITETDTLELQVSIRIEVTGTSTTARYAAPQHCPVCEETTYGSFRSAALADPFSTSGYLRVLESSHHQADCPICETFGEIACDRCNGNGRARCPRCENSGYIIVQARCPMCDGTGGPDVKCPECGGTGELPVRETCPSCDGHGHTSCPECNGDGTVSCDGCAGFGYVHKYDETHFEVRRERQVDNLPPAWEGSEDSLISNFDFDEQDISSIDGDKRRIQVELEPISATFVTLAYDDNHHNLLYQIDHSSVEFIWDAGTGFPKTSIRRKLGDLKSRVRPDIFK